MIWEVAGAMLLYVRLAVVLVVVLVGGYWNAQEVMAARCRLSMLLAGVPCLHQR